MSAAIPSPLSCLFLSLLLGTSGLAWAGGTDAPSPRHTSPPADSVAQSSPIATSAASGGPDEDAGDDADTSGNAPDAAGAQRRGDAFAIRIQAPSALRDMLLEHLELKRYQKVSDLDSHELQRLLALSEVNIRQLLATQGYFSPTIRQTLHPRDPAAAPSSSLSSSATGAARARPVVQIDVEPGPQARMATTQVQLDGSIRTLPAASGQRSRIGQDWASLRGHPFSQSDWNTVKAETLRRLQSRRFPAARLVDSLADVDPDTAQVHLSARYDSGPLYRYGPLRLDGAQRYDPVIIERLVRLPAGQEYRQSDLLDAQKRLLESGYYNGALLHIDTSPDSPADAAPVVVQVQEARLHNLVFGLGMSTDRGPRASVDYTHNLLPRLGWRMVSKLHVDRKQQSVQADLLSPPAPDLWRWMLGAQVQREKLPDVRLEVRQLKWGRTKSADSIDRSYYLQYDHAGLRLDNGVHWRSQAVSAHYSWIYRQFNHATYPTRGYGLALQAGAGVTVYPQRRTFTRLAARYMGFLSLDAGLRDSMAAALPGAAAMRQIWSNPPAPTDGDSGTAADTAQPLLAASSPGARREKGELVLRLETGGVQARQDAVIPTSMLFLTGGDTSVRGYSYQELGVTDTSGLTIPGRYLLAASLEYRRPLFFNNRPSDWDAVFYADTGSVARNPAGLRHLHTGIGAGVLWRSPVGPLQVSVAYGLQSRKMRLHMNMGFSF